MVDPGYIGRAFPFGQRRLGVLDARYALLQQGRKNGLFCTASFTSEEINMALDAGIISWIDLVALNLDEAQALAGSSPDQDDPLSVVKKAVGKLQAVNEKIQVSITAGKQGSYCWDGFSLNSWPSVDNPVVSTAGAGDAFFSGLICGIALGIPLFEAQQLATLVAGLSVTSPHTIHKGINRLSLHDFMKLYGLELSEKIKKLLED
jgi:sugar/nucleoside kinase (ribokinase family)